jgi:hypothetical protein
MHVATGTRWARSLVIVTLLMGVVACSDDPTPAGSVSPSSVSTTPPAQSSSPTPTETPVEQQIEVAVRGYYAELTRAAQTNDTSKLKTMLMRSCPCYNAVRILDRNKKTGRTTPGAAFSLRSVNVHDVTGRAAAAEVRYDVSGYDVLTRDGTLKSHIKAQSSHLDLSLIDVHQTWQVANTFDLEGG